MKAIPPTKNIPSTSSFVKPLEHGHRREATNLNLFEYPFPSRLRIDDNFIPHAVFDLRFMSMFVIENFVITLNPNDPQCNASKEVPNFDLFPILIGNPFPKNGLLPVKTVIIARSESTKLMRTVSGPSPRPLGLDAIPKLVLDRFTCVRMTKWALFGNGGRRNASLPFSDCHHLVLDGPYEGNLLLGPKRAPNLEQVEPVVTGKVTLPLICLYSIGYG